MEKWGVGEEEKWGMGSKYVFVDFEKEDPKI
jgi:hypothetical protein